MLVWLSWSTVDSCKAIYSLGLRQQFQPHFTCGRLVALQCSIHNTIPLFCHFACKPRKYCHNMQCFLHAKWQKIGIVLWILHCKATSRPQVKQYDTSFFVILHVNQESIATTCNAFYIQSDKKRDIVLWILHCKATSRPQVKWGWNCRLWPCL